MTRVTLPDSLIEKYDSVSTLVIAVIALAAP